MWKLCPVPASCCLPYRAADNCLSGLFWPVSIIELCNTPSCGLPALRRSSHGEKFRGTFTQHPRKCDVHPRLWYDLCRRAAGIARMVESHGSDSPRCWRPIRFSFTLFYNISLYPGNSFLYLIRHLTLFSLSFCFICGLAPPRSYPLVYLYSPTPSCIHMTNEMGGALPVLSLLQLASPFILLSRGSMFNRPSQPEENDIEF